MSFIQYKDYLEQYSTIQKLGNGNCATVFKIENKRTKTSYALKLTKLDSVDKLANAFQQVEVVRAIDHPSAIKIYYYFARNPSTTTKCIQFGIIMELANRSIQQDIHYRKKYLKYYTIQQIYELIQILIDFFSHCQEKGYIHRDIKPANILIMSDSSQQKSLKYKICDFGFAIRQHELSDKNIAGTSTYASPKIKNKFKNSNIFVMGNNYKDDVYSLGITLLQICTLQSIETSSPQKLLQKTNLQYGIKLSALLQNMLQFQQQKRYDFIELKKCLSKYVSKRIKNNSLQTSIINDQILISNLKADNEMQTAVSDSLQNDQQLNRNLVKNGENDQNKQKFIYSSPKTHKNVFRARAQKQFTSTLHDNLSNQVNFQKIQNDKDHDKIKTKRRSQMKDNSYEFNKKADEYHDYSSIKRQSSENVDFTFLKNRSNTLPQQHSQNIINNVIKHKFIQKILFIQLIYQKQHINQGQFVQQFVCVATQNHLFFCYLINQKIKVIQLNFGQNKSNICYLKFENYAQKLYIGFKQNFIIALSVKGLILRLSNKNITSIDLQYLSYTSQYTNTGNLCQILYNQNNNGIIKVYQNGNIILGNKLIFSWGTSHIAFAKCIKSSIILASRDGRIVVLSISSKERKILGIYDCKATIIALQFVQQTNGQYKIIAITVSGMIIYLNSYLGFIQTKKLSKNIIRSCTMDLNKTQNQKVLVIDYLGDIYNSSGCIIKQTSIKQAIWFSILNKNKQMYVVNEQNQLICISQNQKKPRSIQTTQRKYKLLY